MTTDTEHDPSAEHAPFDAERLEHLADLAESHQALKRGMNLRELERLAHIDKIASGLSADEKHATKDDPNVINNRNMIENLKRQHRRAQESQQAFNDDVAATAELLERCAKYAARRGYKLGTGWLASAARPQPYDFMREPMHGAEADIAQQRAQRRGVIL